MANSIINNDLLETIKKINTLRNEQIRLVQDTHNRLKPTISAMQEAMMRVANLGKEYSKSINLYTQTNNVYKSFFENRSLQESFKRVRKGLIETEEDVTVFKAAMVDMGYPPHDSLSISQMRYIAKEYRLQGKELVEQVDKFMNKFYSPTRLQKMLLEWEKQEVVKKRLPLLRNVIMAHNIGMYDLVIPAILSQFEGLLFDSYGIKGESKGRIITILLEILLKDFDSRKSAFNFNDAIHKYYSEQVLESFEHGKKTTHGVSRHAILHGSETEFGQSSVSLKVILLFDYLLREINELSDEKIKKAQTEVKQYRKYLERKRNNRKKRK